MITNIVEMLELPKFGHINTSTAWFESHNKVLLVTLWTEIITSWLLFQNAFNLRRPRVANFADIIKIAAMFIKQPLKTPKKLKESEIIN